MAGGRDAELRATLTPARLLDTDTATRQSGHAPSLNGVTDLRIPYTLIVFGSAFACIGCSIAPAIDERLVQAGTVPIPIALFTVAFCAGWLGPATRPDVLVAPLATAPRTLGPYTRRALHAGISLAVAALVVVSLRFATGWSELEPVAIVIAGCGGLIPMSLGGIRWIDTHHSFRRDAGGMG